MMSNADFNDGQPVAAWRRAALTGLTLLAALSAFAPAQAEDAYRIYRNARFGVSADVPRDWRAGRAPDNGDGLKFTSPDGTATLSIFGSLNIADSVDEAMDMEQTANDGETITYRNKTGRSVVISGLRGNTIFYRKSLLSCADQVINHVSLEYPASRKVAFDPLVSRVAASLRGGSGEQVGKCN